MAKVDAKQLLAVAKKNAVSIACGVVALACVAVPFLVADPIVSGVETELQQRASVAGSIDQLLNKSRKQPLLDPTITEAPTLGNVFPTRGVIEAGGTAVKRLTTESENLLKEALRLNVHAPLVPAVFTSGLGDRYTTAFFEFSTKYARIIPDELDKIVNGGRPYTVEEITRAVANQRERIAAERSIRGQGGAVINQQEILDLQRQSDIDVPLAMRSEISSKYATYVSPDTWTVTPNIINVPRPPSPELVWIAQMGLWIQEDVARIIADANKGSRSVFTSPVKHLVKVQFDPATMYVLPKTAGEIGGAGTVTVTGVKPEAPITLTKSLSLTGRTASGLYDVVHYRLIVRVAESYVPEFLALIPRDRLHYVLNCNLRAVDAPSEAAIGYSYGNDRVVELDLTVECLYLRSWTEKYMPKGIRQLVGIDPAPAAVPQ